MKPRVILAGGSGFVGQSLSPLLLSKDYDVVILSRGPSNQRGAVRFVQWDSRTIGPWIECVDGAAAIVNLTGRNINCRHTPENRRDIIDSRVNSVRVLGQAIAQSSQPPKAFVQVSGVGIYGDAGNRWCDENAPDGHDFLAEVCHKWEKAFDAVRLPVTRKILLRLGIALGPNGGLLKPLSTLTKAFLGGSVGDGSQFISWIHIADLTHMFWWAIERVEIAGVFNANAPHPVTNAEFMRELRRALHRPWSPPVPALAAHIGAWLMGTEASLALIGQRSRPENFLEKGFVFKFPTLREALTNIYRGG